jgi:hypothetical protein
MAAAAVAPGQKPDLHGTGANPSAIPNHQTTTVTQDGAHLAAATITADGACRLVSYKTTDSLITMVFEGNRALDHDEYCNYQVTNRYGTAHSWIVVSYTDDEERQLEAQKRAADEKKANAVKALSGSEWTLHLSDGDTVRYTRKPGEPRAGLASIRRRSRARDEDPGGQRFDGVAYTGGRKLLPHREAREWESREWNLRRSVYAGWKLDRRDAMTAVQLSASGDCIERDGYRKENTSQKI